MTSPGLDFPQTSPLVAAELRAEMARQNKSVADLAVALGLKDPKSARARYTGDKSLTVTEVDVAARWLGVPRAQLLDVDLEQAS